MIAVGCDHVGFEYKSEVIKHLQESGYMVKDFGTFSTERTDYPIYGYKVAESVSRGECEKGILICGTGVGISLSANKVKGIRAVVCSDPYTAKLSKEHNNTNILAFGSRVVGVAVAKMIIDEWMNAEYEAGRHQKRIDMISAIEEKTYE